MRKLRVANRTTGLVAAIRAAGGVQALARVLGHRTATVSGYKRVPPKYVAILSEALKLSPEVLSDATPAALPTSQPQNPGDSTDGRDP